MKALVAALLLACALSGAGCGRAEKKTEVTPEPTPPPTLAADADTLHQAQMNAAADHARSASPTPAPSQP